MRFAPRLPRPATPAVLALGMWWGLALAIRLSALSFGLTMSVAIATWYVTSRAEVRRSELARSVVPLMKVLVVAALVMLPFWPYMIVRPFWGAAAILYKQWRAGLGSLAVLYDGHIISSHTVPPSYVWTWLVRITPEFYAVGLIMAAIAVFRHRPWNRDARIGWPTVMAAAVWPLILATATRPAIYDGLRHFLFATVFLAVPAGAGAASCLRRDCPRVLGWTGLGLFSLSVALTAADMIRLHPYQTAFFNRSIAGGLAGAAGRWDTDYWGNSFREGALWLLDHAPAGGPPLKVASSAFPTQTEHFLPRERFEYIGSVDETPGLATEPYADPPDFYVSFTRWARDRLYPGTVIHRVVRDGVTLLVVVKVDRPAALALAGKPRARPER